MKKLIPIILLLLAIPLVSASEIQLYPESFALSLVGGESRNFNITATWTGEAPVIAYSNYDYIEGLTVEIEDIIILEPNTPLTIPIRFVSVPNLAPDNYTIKIWLNAFVEETVRIETVYLGGGGYTEIEKWYENNTRINEILSKYNETLINMLDWRGRYYNLLAENGTIVITNETIQNLTQEEIDRLREIWEDLLGNITSDYEYELDEKDRSILGMQIVFSSVLFILLCLLIFTLRKKQKPYSIV